jgi:hypothetical protein
MIANVLTAGEGAEIEWDGPGQESPLTAYQGRLQRKKCARMSKKALWNMAIGFAGVVYLIVDLWQNIQSPAFAVIFVMVAGYEVIGSQASRHKP